VRARSDRELSRAACVTVTEYVCARGQDIIGIAAVIERLAMALNYAMSSDRALIVADARDKPLWLATNGTHIAHDCRHSQLVVTGCEDRSVLCFFEPPGSCVESDIATYLDDAPLSKCVCVISSAASMTTCHAVRAKLSVHLYATSRQCVTDRCVAGGRVQSERDVQRNQHTGVHRCESS
jgi:hypothetical protein